ncbi:beta-ketoacyl-[acyl-carrier-protein] synthase family protein [Symbiopectobacterium purcellii]|uniref:Beta-ketoacyl-[acyl-carrier-protein] synthase family protein n=1 Tax=Symbiopectobacterium purcellii TaxID=2871826 RepID=A0ABX9AM87_9ENTR|nr:beta-ketoacyl-[acyl-carrier-protein] synthase family protein [Symbiopectobacterium purcellii]QZN95906.1 beta-ketoacyl-[acyl-carrier-protein] synthase family protein [Symbiopectobacterium purcellii]
MIYINAVAALNALGNDLNSIAASLSANVKTALRPDRGWLLHDKPCWTGKVDGDLPAVPAALAAHDSRNNRLLMAALAQIRPAVDEAIAAFGSDRVAVILGTSTSGLDEADRFVSQHTTSYRYVQQELGDPSRFLAAYLQLKGPAYTISTACSSSARALISGMRLIDAGVVDAAIVGGADTLSRMPLNGFDGLESLSPDCCQPFSALRNGISIGEAAGLMLISTRQDSVAILGIGESSDAYHMSAPHPEGDGARRAITMALSQAGLQPDNIGYINLHGTATRLNDDIESGVVHALFGNRVPCSSTKHLCGHTLGAAGITEAVICWLLLTQDIPLPAQDFSQNAWDEQLPDCGLLREPARLARPVIMSNSFAFGGNNTSLILGKVDV